MSETITEIIAETPQDISSDEETLNVATDTNLNSEESDSVENMTLSDENQLGAEMNSPGEISLAEVAEDGYIWKTILREGTWAASPGPGARPVAKPMRVVRDGTSDGKTLTISLQELKDNFDKGLVEHVTIPTTHKDSVLENTGYVKALKIETDEKGRAVLRAAHDFKDPDVKKKILEGTIANVSSGILFDYVHKESGNKNSAVLGHVALTNHPWLNDLGQFSELASDNLEVLGFSEDQTEVIEPSEELGGGEVMSEVQVETPTFLAELGLSEDEVKARLDRYAELEARNREHTINDKVKGWEEADKSPAMITVAKTLLSQSSDVDVILNLSEDGKTVGLSTYDVIDRLMEAAPSLSLATDPINEEMLQEEKPEVDATDENNEAQLSQQEQVLADHLWLTESFTREESIAEAKKRLAKSE